MNRIFVVIVRLFAIGAIALVASLFTVLSLARAGSLPVNRLALSDGGWNFSVKAERLENASCAYRCWQAIESLSSEQAGCINSQIKEVKDLLSDGRNAAYLKKSGVRRIQVRLVDNTAGTLPLEKHYEQIHAFLFSWMMEVQATLTSRHVCSVASSKLLNDFIEQHVRDEVLMEQTIDEARKLLQLAREAPERVSDQKTKRLEADTATQGDPEFVHAGTPAARPGASSAE